MKLQSEVQADYEQPVRQLWTRRYDCLLNKVNLQIFYILEFAARIQAEL